MKKLNAIFVFLFFAVSSISSGAQDMSSNKAMPMSARNNNVSKAVCIVSPTHWKCDTRLTSGVIGIGK